MKRPGLILASASPRRRELLAWAGVEFEVWPAQVEETVLPGETPQDNVRRLALAKAKEAAARFPHSWVLSADTIVVLDGRIMGKPGNETRAADMLRRLSGRVHLVMTGFCLLAPQSGPQVVDHVETEVEFRELSDRDIARYIASGEVWDKAGAYAVQGQGAGLVSRIKGSYTNVIGLPLAEVLGRLKDFGLLPSTV
ncbi:MAG: nucleoside triphosphate pyrophosphatase [Pseudomonadota bacterium]